MKKTLVNTLNKAGRIYRATHNGLMYVVANGCGFIFADTLDGLDPDKLNPETWDSTAGNNAAQILKLVQDAIDYNEPALIPVYNLGTVTHSTGKMIIVEDESKEARAAFNEKICNYADSFGKNELYLYTPDGEKPGPHSWLIGTLDGVINIALLPINFRNNAVDLADLAAEARENTKAAAEAAEAKKAAQKAAKAARAAAIQAAKDQTAKDQTETTPAEDASAAPVQEKPADDNADQAAETEPAAMDPAADQTAETETTPRIYAYYLPHRPVSIGTQPRGFMNFEDLDKAETGYYSIVRYERELTSKEIADYELVPAADQTPADPEKTDAEKPETAPAENNADTLAEAGQTETDQADTAADNGPETSEAVQAEKPAKKREKKPEPREIMTEKEAAGLLTGPDWTTNAAMLIGFDMRNSNLIMQAALDAGLLTPEMILAYLFYYKMPAFHTFNAWKDHGYIVKRGEKAAFAAKIWKYKTTEHVITEKEAADLAAYGEGLGEAGDIIESGDYLMKTAYFFTADQVEKITRGQVDIPADCKRTTQDGREIITGNTRPIKEQIKAAGYMWDKYNKIWWRPIAAAGPEIMPAVNPWAYMRPLYAPLPLALPMRSAFSVPNEYINEETARRHKENISFSDYKPGTATKEYRDTVQALIDYAEKCKNSSPYIKADPARVEEAQRYINYYAKKIATYINRDNEIGTRCPSVLIAGPANFPTRKKAKQVAAWDANHRENYIDPDDARHKIYYILSADHPIKGTDPEAVEKLKAKLASLEESHAREKEAVKAAQKRFNADLKAGIITQTRHYYGSRFPEGFSPADRENPALLEALAGFDRQYIGTIYTKDGKEVHKPAMSYRSGLHSQEKKRLEKRIAELEALNNNDSGLVIESTSGDGWTFETDTAAKRYIFTFDGKPDQKYIETLKSNGFRWSPRFNSWSRQITTRARWNVRQVLEALAA